MIQLINISDVRKYRQLGKQVNIDSFNGHLRTVQETILTPLLGRSLSYDFFNYLKNGFTDVNETYEYISADTFKILASDKTNLLNFALKINNTIFVKVIEATFDSTDTIIKVSGYDLSSPITSVFYSSETKYVDLLNGTIYITNNETIEFTGLRPFLSWHLLVSYLVDGSLKQSDVGNIQILGDNFQKSSQSDVKIAKSDYLQNATVEYNNIIEYLSNNTNIYTLYKNNNTKQNLSDYDFFIV